MHRVAHLLGGLDRARPRRRPATGWSAVVTSTTARARGGPRRRDRVAHLPRRPVADEAHRIDRLAGAARGDEDRAAGERTGRPREQREHACDDALRVGEPAGADVAAREAAVLGLEHVHAAPAQRREVLLHRRVLPHLGVHRRAHEHRRARGEQRRGEQVVGDAGRVLADAASRWPARRR